MNKTVCKIAGFDEFGPLLEWSKHWSEFPVGTALARVDAAEQALPLKDRPDFIAGYDAGLKDGRACERRDAAEQAAQAVPAGFKWVPVEPTEDMLTAAGREDDKAFVDGMPHGATAADVWAAMLSASPKPEAVAGWRDIETAPKETEVLIGRWIDGKFKWGSSELFYEQANEFEGETFSGWVWSIDYCDDSVAEAPTHWIPLPAAPPEPTHD